MSESPEELEARAKAVVAAVTDDPEGRFRLRQAFYQRFGFGDGNGFGASELKFLRWEISRGVLNPLTGGAPGSAWWRNVNAALLVHAESAALLFDAGHADASDAATRQWLAYLRQPTSHSWYRAHNASIVCGYLNNCEAAAKESLFEQTFMNMVLYRLLYAQALLEGEAPILMKRPLRTGLDKLLDALEQCIADPRSPGVDLMVHLPDFYPPDYPLRLHDLAYLFKQGHLGQVLAEAAFDYVLVSPLLHDLYSVASEWLGMPDLNRLVKANRPIYPNIAPAP